MPNKTIYASALLVDNKIKFWKVSGNYKKEVADFYKEFFYSSENVSDYIDKDNVRVEITEFIETENNNQEIFHVLAPKWFSQWELIDNYKGKSPFDISTGEDFIINISTPKIDNYDIFTKIVPCSTQLQAKKEANTLIDLKEFPISMCQIDFLMNYINKNDDYKTFSCKISQLSVTIEKEQSTSNIVSNIKNGCKEYCKMWSERFDT